MLCLAFSHAVATRSSESDLVRNTYDAASQIMRPTRCIYMHAWIHAHALGTVNSRVR